MTPSEQARADGMADAETLRLMASEFPSFGAALDAAWCCPCADCLADPSYGWIERARASIAFRAVPGLRP